MNSRMLTCFVALTLMSSWGCLDAQVINTIAGGGVGDGGNATNAKLGFPNAIAADALGNVFIADSANNRIRKVASNGLISTVAGDGIASFSGDGGLALNAELNNPTAVAIDSTGNLYIADSANYRIRKIATNGIITTVAGNGTGGFSGDGGAATNANLFGPTSVVVDASGNLYIADTFNERIRKVATSGIIISIAGNGTYGYSGDGGPATRAELADPVAIAIDASGNVYIAEAIVPLTIPDTLTNRIRKISSGGIISTVAGNGTKGYSGDGGPATSAALDNPSGIAVDASGNLFVADTYNSVIRKVAGGTIATIVGTGIYGFFGDGGQATNATLGYPMGVTLDSSSNIFVADTGNNRVRKVSSTGIINTLAGASDGHYGFSSNGAAATNAVLDIPVSVAVDNVGGVYFADSQNNVIRKVASNGTITTVAGDGLVGYTGDGTSAIFSAINEPQGVAVDTSGNLYIADTYNNRVRKVSSAGIISTVAGNGTIGYSGDGAPATNATLYNPNAVAVDASGNIFVADTGNNVVRKVAANGVISTVAGDGTHGFSGDGGPATNAKLASPNGVVIGATGNLYIGDSNNAVIRKVASNGIITTVAGNGTGGFSGDGGAATNAKISSSKEIALDSSENLYIADVANDRIREVKNGIISTVAGNGDRAYYGDGGLATAAALQAPAGVAVDARGNIFIADQINNRIREVVKDEIFKDGFQ